MLDQALINSILVGLLMAAVAFMATAYWTRSNRRDAEAKAKAAALAAAEKAIAAERAEERRLSDVRIDKLEKTVIALTSALSGNVTPISTAMQAVLIQTLTKDHTPELDALLVKVLYETIEPEEQPRLFQLLDATARNVTGDITPREQDAAVMLPYMMRWVKGDRLLKVVEVQVVSKVKAGSDSNHSLEPNK